MLNSICSGVPIKIEISVCCIISCTIDPDVQTFLFSNVMGRRSVIAIHWVQTNIWNTLKNENVTFHLTPN